MANTFTYQLGSSLYINLTNRCSNNCDFCIRNFSQGVGGYDLFLEREPSAAEVIEQLGDPGDYDEYVFCGFGEPLVRLEAVIEISKYIKDQQGLVRINTNGQANLIHGRSVPPLLEELVDTLSISLNAGSKEEYNRLCNPDDPEHAYPSLIQFIEESGQYIDRVILSAVASSGVNLEQVKEKAEELGFPLRIR